MKNIITTIYTALSLSIVIMLTIKAIADPAYSQSNLPELTQSEQQRYLQIISELRCLVCQNQSIAESNATLAIDLRLLVAEKIRNQDSNEQIYTFMTERYGDFVRYRPPLTINTLLLWLIPALVFTLFAIKLYHLTKKRK